jgi:hypothetical protein
MRGMKVDDIAAALSMGHMTVRAAIKTADKGGIKALQPKPTGRPVGNSSTIMTITMMSASSAVSTQLVPGQKAIGIKTSAAKHSWRNAVACQPVRKPVTE